MDTFFMFYNVDENIFHVDWLTDFPQFCVLGIVLCLLISYSVYCKVLWRFLEKTKLPKLYKITTLHSLWMGSIHLLALILCFSQLSPVVHSLFSTKSSHPFSLNEILYAATANFCQQTTDHNDSFANSLEGSVSSAEEVLTWTSLNSISTIIICAILIQEILLSTRNRMNYIFYSRLLGLIFVISAVNTRCPILSIQGAYLMSINSSSREIARALVAWKSYSQEDSDHHTSPVTKAATFLVFLCHMLIWFSLMLFYMPLFIHKLPSVTKSDPKRLFLAYAYLSFLAYTVLEVVTSPLWKTIRCMGWCRRSSGISWRILALSDCHLLGHYGPLVLELYNIQVILDVRKSLLRSKMVQKHLASLEGRKRRSQSDQQVRRPASLLAAVKTMVALKKKIQRRVGDNPAHSVTLEDLPQVLLKAGSNVETDLADSEELSTPVETPEVSDKEEFTVEEDDVTPMEGVPSIKVTFANEVTLDKVLENLSFDQTPARAVS